MQGLLWTNSSVWIKATDILCPSADRSWSIAAFISALVAVLWPILWECPWKDITQVHDRVQWCGHPKKFNFLDGGCKLPPKEKMRPWRIGGRGWRSGESAHIQTWPKVIAVLVKQCSVLPSKCCTAVVALHDPEAAFRLEERFTLNRSIPRQTHRCM